jgi:hypothetical protein
MSRARTDEVRVGAGDGHRHRPAYYEDYVKPVLVKNWPIMLVASAAVLVVGLFVNWGSGV